MKWVLVLSFCFLGCTEQRAPAVTGGPGSGVGVGGGGSGGSSAVDGGTDAAVDGGEPKGACDNESDLEALAGVGDDGRDIARICGLPNNSSSFCASLIFNAPQYEACITECVEEEVPGLSSECANCYGALERCGVAQIPSCRTQCQLNGCSTLCLDCLNLAGCIEEYEDCRGLPGDGCAGSP